ncbi:MAG: metallophosphoesterase, partial [Bacteroidota bacterium]|nr:metallophosphoesterase [Candidatus Kapabacteria bacterium]MDW8220773.1 metallophosphoesterase [Bacteroidota bacterium]
SAAIRFFVIGDWGTGTSFQHRVAAAMCSKAGTEKPSFILSTGDNIYNNGVTSIDDLQWKTKFEDVYTCTDLQIPWYVVLGNHDHRGNIQAQRDYHKKNPRWNLPNRYYHVRMYAADSTTLDIFALDTDPLHRNDTAFLFEQSAWLHRCLAASQAHWKIVVGHHMIRSHGAYGDQEFMLRWIKPILDEYNIPLYINGHDHDLQYLKASADKFYCLTSGAGGGARNTAYGTNTIFAATNGGYTYIAVMRHRIYIEFIDIHGTSLFATSIPHPSR